MRYILTLLCISFIIACNQSDPDHKPMPVDTSHTSKSEKTPATDTTTTGTKKDGSLNLKSKDSLLMKLSVEILASLKTKDLVKLASFVHPTAGIRFSPYAYIDTINGQVVSATKLIALAKQQTTVKWGVYDGSGETIKLSIDKYFERFVYSKDFLNAEKKSVNTSNKTGNSLDNLEVVHPGSDYTEFYFSGFDPKFEGMDWQKLRLVFRIENRKPYLLAIIHDEWTI